MRKKSTSRKVFEVINYTVLCMFIAVIIIPFLNVIAMSISDSDAVRLGKVGIWPIGFNTNAYRNLLISRGFFRTFINTVCLTSSKTVLVILISLSAAYALANKAMFAKKFFFTYILIPMYFSGGLVPFYLLVNGLKLTDTYAALILPYIVSIFYIIVFRNSILQMPKDLIESAEIDGASEFTILYRVVIPVLLPMVMAFTIFSAVDYWNDWYNVLLFIKDTKKWTLQFLLRDILINADVLEQSEISNYIIKYDKNKIHPQNLKMAALMITVLPIIVIYPFLQKYFIHGIIVGAVKG